MQLGYTIPLQKHLKIPKIPYGAPCDLRFCWDLHILKPGGRPSLFCVHASSRFAVLLYDMTGADWEDIPGLFRQELRRVLLEEGFPQTKVERYLALAREVEITKTHGRRPVAFLNRAVDDFYALPVGPEPDRLEQQAVRVLLNDFTCRAAGHEGRGTAREFLHQDLRRLVRGTGVHEQAE